MKKPVLWGVVFVLIVLGVIIYSSMGLAAYRYEVCMQFNGRTNCRTASGENEEAARRAATTNACAAIASGVTDSMACERSEPVKINRLK